MSFAPFKGSINIKSAFFNLIEILNHSDSVLHIRNTWSSAGNLYSIHPLIVSIVILYI